MSRLFLCLVVTTISASWSTGEAALVMDKMALEAHASAAKISAAEDNRTLELSIAYWNAFPSYPAAIWYFRPSDTDFWSDLVLSSHHDADTALGLHYALTPETLVHEPQLQASVELAAFSEVPESGWATDPQLGIERPEEVAGKNQETHQQGPIAVWLLGASVLALIGIGRRRARRKGSKPQRAVPV